MRYEMSQNFFSLIIFSDNYPIYLLTKLFTIKIRIQGGIKAAKGFTGIFMVHSVEAVSTVGRIKREHQSPVYSGNVANSSNGSFAQVLERAKEETQESPMNCVTTTYGRDCKMRTFFYQPREYHF